MELHSSTLSIIKLVSEHHHGLMRLLRSRLRGRAEAADVAQEAYLRMLQFEGTSHIRSPYSMLVRIALNVARDMNRANRTRRIDDHSPLDGHDLVSDVCSPEAELEFAQDLDKALAAIDSLPPRRRQIFLLHRVDHLSYDEIARKCGISVKMVEKHISAALAVCAASVWGVD